MHLKWPKSCSTPSPIQIKQVFYIYFRVYYLKEIPITDIHESRCKKWLGVLSLFIMTTPVKHFKHWLQAKWLLLRAYAFSRFKLYFFLRSIWRKNYSTHTANKKLKTLIFDKVLLEFAKVFTYYLFDVYCYWIVIQETIRVVVILGVFTFCTFFLNRTNSEIPTRLLHPKKHSKTFSGQLLIVFLNWTNLAKLNCLLHYEQI